MKSEIQQTIERDMADQHKEWICWKCGCTVPEAWLGYCSWYGLITPDGHKCGDQKDNDYPSPGPSNPDNKDSCLPEIKPLDEETYQQLIEEIGSDDSDKLGQYDIHYRCSLDTCQILTSKEF